MTADTVTIKEIAQALNLSAKHVRERLVHRPGFPLPYLVAGPRSRLWLRADVIAWATPAARKSQPQTPCNTPAGSD